MNPTAPREKQSQEEEALVGRLSTAVLARMAESFQREKAAGTTPSTNFVHGPTGILSLPGQRADVINAMVMPRTGLLNRLPWRPSNFANEVLPILTGQTAGSGDEPETACEDCAQPGNLKVCNQTFPFGRLCLDSQVLQVDRPGLLVNRSEFTDMRLVGNPFADSLTPQPVNPNLALRSEVEKKILEMYVDWVRRYSHLVYDGNPANTTGNTGYIEFNGLDMQINTGHVDAYTGTPCAAADSTIVDFNGNLNVSSNENRIVQAIVEVIAYLSYLAEQTGQAPVQFGLAMRYSLFRRLSEIYPCVYMTYRCTFGSTTNATNFVSAEMQVKMRDDMRNGIFDGRDIGTEYLLVDGKAVPVIIDDTLPEEVPSANNFQSDIYVIPLTFRDGRRAVYWEYFDFNAPYGTRDVINEFAPNSYTIRGNGRWLFHRKPPSQWCVQLAMLTKPRLILETPFLAARITNVTYSPPLFHERNFDPNSPYYFVDGGLQSANAPFFYPPTV